MASVKLGVIKIVKKGQHYALDLNQEQKEQCQHLFDLCFNKKGGYVRAEFKTPAKQRSTGKNSQNSHLNGHIQQICEDTGNSFDIVKLAVKEQALDRGYPMLLDKEGVPQVGLFNIRLGISEADSTVEECKILIDAVHLLAAEYDIRLRED